MSKILLAVLASCSAVLAGVLYLELAHEAPVASPAGAQQQPKASAAAPGAEIPAAEDDESDVNNILARPLFTPGRKPPPRAMVANADGDQAAPFDGKLVGIMLTPSSKEALLFDDTKNVSSAVHEGESFGGWTLEEISPANVTFRDGERTVTIELLTDTGQNNDDGDGSAPKKPPKKPGKTKTRDRAANQAKNQTPEQAADVDAAPRRAPPRRIGPRQAPVNPSPNPEANKESQPMHGPLIGKGLQRLMPPGVNRP